MGVLVLCGRACRIGVFALVALLVCAAGSAAPAATVRLCGAKYVDSRSIRPCQRGRYDSFPMKRLILEPLCARPAP